MFKRFLVCFPMRFAKVLKMCGGTQSQASQHDQLTNQCGAMLYGKAETLEDNYKHGINISNVLRFLGF